MAAAPPAFSPYHSLRQRLLRDIAELQRNPYPGVALHVKGDDLRTACLILTPEGERSLHLQIDFPNDYPLSPPSITIQSSISHPNVYGNWICCNILRQGDGYTPAYSLKSICIQMLSFFGSDRVEQEHGEKGGIVDRKRYAESHGDLGCHDAFSCIVCGFEGGSCRPAGHSLSDFLKGKSAVTASQGEGTPKGPSFTGKMSVIGAAPQFYGEVALAHLPMEVLLMICDHLTEEEDLLRAACAFKGFAHAISRYNILRTRELQCFTLKLGFCDVVLGVGVHVSYSKQISSEFDLLSYQAFFKYNVRKSVQGLPFIAWMPLPLSHRHWLSVRPRIKTDLDVIGTHAGLKHGEGVKTLFTFMNDIVVRLSKEVEGLASQTAIYDGPPRSSLTHASEKAVEGYFQLFHLLLCVALDDGCAINDASSAISDFVAGQRDKKRCPNLGHLLIQILLCDERDISRENLTKAVITEAITRNVVWMLDRRGSDVAGLSYLETGVSHYRLQKTFEAGKTSYRLLMFLNMMRQIVLSTSKSPSLYSNDHATPVDHVARLTLLRDTLFTLHGAPPSTFSASLIASRIRQIQAINTFPSFLRNMGLEPPTAMWFSQFLRQCLRNSVSCGYSQWALTQPQALFLRLSNEDRSTIEGVAGVKASCPPKTYSFFPGGQNAKSRRGLDHPYGNRGGIIRGSRGRKKGRGRGQAQH